LAALFLAAGPAWAGIGGSIVPDFPATVNVGDTFNATLTLTNNSDGGNLAESVSATGVFLFPSCAAGLGICTTPDPGVFSLSATGTGTAGSCVGDTFTIVEDNPATSEWSFIRNGGPFVLGPSNNAATKFCTITYQVTVLKLPTLDSNGGLNGLQTLQVARVNTLQGLTTGQTGQAAGSDETTVTSASLQVLKTPDGATITAGQTAEFTIQVTNTGTGTATNVTVTDTLPAGFTWSVSQQPAAGTCGIVGQLLTCNLGNMAPGAVLTLKVSAPTSATACGPIINDINGGAIADADNTPPVTDPGSITCQVPVLLIVKTPDGATITAGQNAVFSITLTNQGPGTATGVQINDALPAGFTWTVSQQPAQGTCSITGGTALNCAIGNLAQGASVTVQVSAPTSVQACGPINNTVNGGAIGTATNAAQVNDPGTILCQVPVLQIAKTPDGGTITAGQNAVLTIVLTNQGQGTATGVAINDALPAGFTWSVSQQPAQGTCQVNGGTTLVCAIGNLAQGASVTVQVSAPTSAQACGAINNTTNGGAIGTATNAAQVSDPGTILCQQPVLQIVKTPDTPGQAGGTITAGQNAVFSITLTNQGPGTATGVAINDALPAGFTWTVSQQPAQGTCQVNGGTTLVCAIGDLAQGASVTVQVSAPTSVQACGNIINNTNGGAIGTATNAAQVSDPGAIVCQVPVLQIVKTPDGATINAGQTAEFTIVLTNQGPGTATGVAINDALPAGFTWSVSQQPAQGTCQVNGGTTLVCTIGSLAQGASVTVKVSAPTSQQACGPINNTTNGGAIGSATNAASVSDPGTITCQFLPPDLHIVKTPDNGTYQLGDTVSFTIVVSNTGQGPSTNTQVTDNLPVPAGSGLVWGPASPVPTCSGQTGTLTCSVVNNALSCNLGTLNPGGSCSITVSSPTDPANPAACVPPPGLQNTATATNAEGENESDTGNQSCELFVGICRTPGFWGTHACGTSGSLDPAQCEKVRGDTAKARNVTQLALDLAIDKAGGSLMICGQPISNTSVGSGESALEAICVSPSTDKSAPLQVARQLMSAALNCAISNENLNDALCEGTSNDALFNACNTACAAANGHSVTATVNGFQVSCGEAIDCINNGRVFHLDTGMCGESSGCHDETLTNVGACTISGDLCSSNDPCAPGAGECKSGPAGSSKACNAARDNNCTIFSPGC
jgi:uncharacterized repeat protein (TIGR01451 family)